MLFLTEVVDYCKFKPAALLYLTVAKPNRSTLGHKKYPTGWLRASRRRRAGECRLAPDFMCEGIGATTWHVLEGWHRQKTRALLAVVWTLLPHTLASGPIRCARRSVSAQFLLSGSEDPLPPFPAGILRSDLWPVAACVYFMPAPAD